MEALYLDSVQSGDFQAYKHTSSRADTSRRELDHLGAVYQYTFNIVIRGCLSHSSLSDSSYAQAEHADRRVRLLTSETASYLRALLFRSDMAASEAQLIAKVIDGRK